MRDAWPHFMVECGHCGLHQTLIFLEARRFMQTSLNRFARYVMIVTFFLCASSYITFPQIAHAQSVESYELLQSGSSAEEASLGAMLGQSGASVTVVVLRLIRSFIGLLGVLIVVIILIAGFEWMAAGGNETKVAEAKEMVLRGVIGMVIVLSVFAIAQFIINALVSGVAGAP